MKIGFVSDSLGGLSFEAVLDNAARIGVNSGEVVTGTRESNPKGSRTP